MSRGVPNGGKVAICKNLYVEIAGTEISTFGAGKFEREGRANYVP